MTHDSLRDIASEIRHLHRNGKAYLYHPLPFSEFADVKSSSPRAAAVKKWHLMDSALAGIYDFKGLRVLDVGANVGFHSFSFARKGASVDAFEPEQDYASLGSRIAAATGLHVRYHAKIIDIEDLRGREYDVAILLSVFQWMAQGGKRIVEAKQELREISNHSKVVFFELGCNHGTSALHTEEIPILWIRRLLHETCPGNEVKLLGTTVVWSRRRFVFVCGKPGSFRLNRWQVVMNHEIEWLAKITRPMRVGSMPYKVFHELVTGDSMPFRIVRKARRRLASTGH